MFLVTAPDTSVYMIAGFVITFLAIGLYVFSLYLRHRNLYRALKTKEIINSESKPMPPSDRAGASKPRGKA